MSINEINYRKLLKKEMIWLWENYCRHGHRYAEHISCFYTESPDASPIQEKIGFLDIETTNFKASFGLVISWALKEKDGGLFGAHVTKEDIDREANSKLSTPVQVDKNILRKLCEKVSEYDKVCVYWGKNRRFDIPFIRHRCLKTGIDFPIYQDVMVVDVYDWTKNFLSLSSYRLGIVCKEFGIPAKQHDMHPSHWQKAACGNMKAIKYIYEHNKEDVLCLEPVYNLLEPFARRQRTSI